MFKHFSKTELTIIFVTLVILAAATVWMGKAEGAELPGDPVKCLADNIYYEAANEPFAGKVAVAQVTLNRVADPAYPATICGVVYERHVVDGKKVAAFSWTLGRSWRAPGPIDANKYAVCRRIAIGVIDGVLRSIVIDSHVKWYRAVYLNVNWHKRVAAKIGHHVFYRG